MVSASAQTAGCRVAVRASRCQRNIVAGVTSNGDQRSRGNGLASGGQNQARVEAMPVILPDDHRGCSEQ